jgi:O-antigen/teichoic acid export membrane protein
MHTRLLTQALLGRAPAGSHSQRRYASILRGGVTALLAKLVAMLAALASVPLTLRYLGAERYGLWATLFSLLSWLSIADLGLSNGLMNALSHALGQERRDLAREYVSTAFWGLCAIALLLGLVLALMHDRLDWQSLMHLRSAAVAAEFASAIALAALIFALNLPLTIVGRVFIAMQRPELANFWAIGTTLGGLAGLVTAVALHGGLAALVLGFAGGQLLVASASAAWLFVRRCPELLPGGCVSRASARRVFGVSGAFFVTQLATLLIFQSGNFIIAHHLGPKQVAPYQVTWLLALYVQVPQQLIGASVWAAIGEAYARADLPWIRQLIRRYSAAGLLLCVPLIIGMLIAGEPLVRWWAGAAAQPSHELILWMTAWAAELVLMQPLIAVLGGTGRLREYALCSLCAALVAVAGGWLLVDALGAVGVIASTVVSFFCLALLPALYLVARTLRQPPALLAHA